MSARAIEARDVARTFGGGLGILRRRRRVHAVMGVSLDVGAGETLGVVGETGSGKTTLARMLAGLDRPTSGAVLLDGAETSALAQEGRKALARTIQYVFQNPVASLNPRRTVAQTLAAPLARLDVSPRAERAARIARLLDDVGLSPALLDRYPHEISGGQAQRVAIARALAAEARMLVLDEPVSALDVSVQAQILNLLADLKAEHGLTYVFIGHDLAVVESDADRIAVMYFGRIVEIAPAGRLFHQPRHPYTDLLRRSAPRLGAARSTRPAGAPTELPDPTRPPRGCAFAARCPLADARCRAERPPLAGDGAGETLGDVGETASGKTTLARMLAGLDRPTSRAVLLDGAETSALAQEGR
ncbi:MAG: ATP-binding cassette domain-containing protein, partial [Alphaproteobacteria bacterium]